MTRFPKVCIFLFVLSAGLLAQCGEEDLLTQSEIRKLDARLQMLVSSKDIHDAQKIVVLIHGSRPDDIRSIGAEVDEVAGGIVIASVTIPELKRIVRLPSVQSIESNTTKSPQP